MVPIPTSTGTDIESRFARIEQKLDKIMSKLDHLERMINPPLPSEEELAYIRKVDEQVKSHWKPQTSNYSQNCDVVFNVNSSGKISGIRLGRRSAALPTPFEQIALEAVRQLSVLPPPPIRPGEEIMQISLHFGYNLLH
jgi:hypothetical protein